MNAPAAPINIGDAWLGIDGIYAGISRGRLGAPDAHIVLLNAKPPADMTWADAHVWARSLGGGARLPTPMEAALLWANLRDRFDTERWYWLLESYTGEHEPWVQEFKDGAQGWEEDRFRNTARAVLRIATAASGGFHQGGSYVVGEIPSEQTIRQVWKAKHGGAA